MYVCSRLATLVEQEIEAWYKIDPDPFDDRHPGRYQFTLMDLSEVYFLKSFQKTFN